MMLTIVSTTWFMVLISMVRWELAQDDRRRFESELLFRLKQIGGDVIQIRRDLKKVPKQEDQDKKIETILGDPTLR